MFLVFFEAGRFIIVMVMFYTINYRVSVFLLHMVNESFIIIRKYTYDILYSTCIIHLLMQPTWYDFLKMSLIFLEAGQFIVVIVKSAIYLAKLIDVRFHQIRELIVTRDIVLETFHTLENVDDMLTKPVPLDKFKHCLDLVSVCSL